LFAIGDSRFLGVESSMGIGEVLFYGGGVLWFIEGNYFLK